MLQGVVDPVGAATRFEHDLAGRVTAVVDPAGNRTEYQFDAAGRLTRRLDPAPNAWWGEPTTDSAYNLNDQVVSIGTTGGYPSFWRPRLARGAGLDTSGLGLYRQPA